MDGWINRRQADRYTDRDDRAIDRHTDGWIIIQINRQTDDRVINIKNNGWMEG